MFEIKLTLSADEQTLAAINNLTAALTGKPASTNPLSAVPPAGKTGRGAKAAAPAAEEPKKEEPVTEELKKDEPSATEGTATTGAPEVTEPEPKKLTLEEVRAKVKEAIDGGKLNKTVLAATLKEFGAAKVPELKPEHFNSFLAKIAA